jgi:hypothetical protein
MSERYGFRKLNMSASGQTEKHSERADVFRSSPKNGRLALPATLSGSKVRNFIGWVVSEIRRSNVMEQNQLRQDRRWQRDPREALLSPLDPGTRRCHIGIKAHFCVSSNDHCALPLAFIAPEKP